VLSVLLGGALAPLALLSGWQSIQMSARAHSTKQLTAQIMLSDSKLVGRWNSEGSSDIPRPPKGEWSMGPKASYWKSRSLLTFLKPTGFMVQSLCIF
jgi:hypothetical protein